MSSSVRGMLIVWGAVGTLGLSAGACSNANKDVINKSNELWGAKRGCLPCHAYRLPIARNHNYPCDTCHGGKPNAKAKEIAHKDLFPRPQDDTVIKFTCQKCHNEKLGKDVPYDAEFVKDLLVSHGDYAE